MNIFVLDACPIRAAQSLCDSHVSKMILETAQLLSTYAHKIELDFSLRYKPTHRNHPCSKWLEESDANVAWLLRHGIAMSEEFVFRRGKGHKSSLVIQEFGNRFQRTNDCAMTPFAQAMPDDLRCDDAVIAYRRYYLRDKRHIAKWTPEERRPDWWR